MLQSRFSFLISGLSLALVLVWGGGSRGQTSTSEASPLVILENVGLPAIDRGVIPDESHTPDSPESLRRRSIQSGSATLERVGASGARYVAGRVIVKFRDGTSTPSRLSTLSAVSRAASISARPAYANFDVVQIDPNEDAEAIAQTLSQ